MQKSILIIDDDPKIRSVLSACFESEGIGTQEAADGASALAALEQNAPDLVTLDLHLGAESGLDVARQIRSRSQVPIVMVTGKGDVLDRIVGLEIGADDYITKPFHVREVLARVRAVLRRTSEQSTQGSAGDNAGTASGEVAHFGPWTVRPDHFELTQDGGAPCQMTTAEFKLLMVFLKHPRRILSREQLMDMIGGAAWAPLDRTIDNQVARLRKRIETDPANPEFVKTVRGIGYSFTAEVRWE